MEHAYHLRKLLHTIVTCTVRSLRRKIIAVRVAPVIDPSCAGSCRAHAIMAPVVRMCRQNLVELVARHKKHNIHSKLLYICCPLCQCREGSPLCISESGRKLREAPDMELVDERIIKYRMKSRFLTVNIFNNVRLPAS